MTEANLAIARKVILYVGLLVAALLFIYPHWRIYVHTGAGQPAVNHELGRAFITFPPLLSAESSLFLLMGGTVRIHYIRQITEVAIALLFTFGLMRALKLKKPAGDGKHDAEE